MPNQECIPALTAAVLCTPSCSYTTFNILDSLNMNRNTIKHNRNQFISRFSFSFPKAYVNTFYLFEAQQTRKRSQKTTVVKNHKGMIFCDALGPGGAPDSTAVIASCTRLLYTNRSPTVLWVSGPIFSVCHFTAISVNTSADDTPTLWHNSSICPTASSPEIMRWP